MDSSFIDRLIFSGALCAQGVNGLKLVHKATNEFLGCFVDIVYQHGGDGKCKKI